MNSTKPQQHYQNLSHCGISSTQKIRLSLIPTLALHETCFQWLEENYLALVSAFTFSSLVLH